jgi:wobble nucleotide-excising tRNase
MLAVSKIGDRALHKIAMYNPNLIANLSKEAYDIYVIRKKTCEYIFSLVTTQGMTLDNLKKILNEEVKEVKIMRKNTDSEEEKAFFGLKIKELEDYL